MDHYLDKLHGEILAIMDEIHRVCQIKNIKYYLIGGSMLGAVRHKGFIPWDDDLDIAMPREDFERFVEGATEWLSSDFSLEWITTNPNHVYLFAKITKKGTLFIDQPSTKQTGIFVDVFPLDSSPKYNFRVELRKFLIWRIEALLWHKLKKDIFPKYFYLYLPSILFDFKMCHRVVSAIAKGSNTDKRDHYSNYASSYKIKRENTPKEWWGDGRLAEFEDRRYYIPNSPDKILEIVFGADYMQLPPENERRSHYPSKVRFSDGETMDFEYSQ